MPLHSFIRRSPKAYVPNSISKGDKKKNRSKYRSKKKKKRKRKEKKKEVSRQKIRTRSDLFRNDRGRSTLCGNHSGNFQRKNVHVEAGKRMRVLLRNARGRSSRFFGRARSGAQPSVPFRRRRAVSSVKRVRACVRWPHTCVYIRTPRQAMRDRHVHTQTPTRGRETAAAAARSRARTCTGPLAAREPHSRDDQ